MEDYIDGEDNNSEKEEVVGFVMRNVDDWRDHFNSNYREKFDEYYRLWRGQWSAQDKTRDSERSQIISPALQQAVESNVAEIEEATFGRGKWFDIKDDVADQDNKDIVTVRTLLEENFQHTKVRKAVVECLINAAVYGTGVAEIVVENGVKKKPATRPMLDGALEAVGVMEIDTVNVKLRPINPQNFLIDPVATSIEDALGVAIDEFVPRHQVEMGMKEGIYFEKELSEAEDKMDLESDKTLAVFPEGKVRLTKYFGLIPREMYNEYVNGEEKSEDKEDEVIGDYVEVICVIANGGILLKLDENPFMMQDRPVVAFPWDTVPGRFWGRGVCEKGYNSQKALDAELRARMDSLALTVHPMMAADATRIPRGTNFKIQAGRMILTNGDPREILQPFKFGSLDQNTFTQAAELQRMVQMATGAIDAAGIPGSINGDSTAAGTSMALGAIIKRHKRTLVNFQESFLIPFVEKAAWRFMQFNPDVFPTADYKFNASSSLGIIAREYEVTQLVQLLQTMPPESPAHMLLVQSVVDNMQLANREEIIAKMQEASQPNPQQQQAMQAQQQQQMQALQQQQALVQAQINEINARTQKTAAETQAIPMKVEIDRIKAVNTNLPEDNMDKNFQRRLALVDTMLKQEDIQSNERIAAMQMQKNQAKDLTNQ